MMLFVEICLYEWLAKQEDGMDHGPNTVESEDGEVVARNQRLGLRLFAVYAVTYLLFILCCVASPELLEASLWLGISNSVSFGFGLIFLAIAIALIYGLACRGSGSAKSRSGPDALPFEGSGPSQASGQRQAAEAGE